jgi:serine/threonine protein kinase
MSKPIEFYKENLREEVKHYTKISSGFTSTIYGNVVPDFPEPSFIIKEIYLDNTLEKSNKYDELLLNIYFREHSRYLKYVVPMISYDTYDRILLMKFEYMGDDLEQYLLKNIETLTVKELRKIYKKIVQALKSLNKSVFHNDLHIANIFVNPETFEVKIGDWGKGEFASSMLEKEIDIWEYTDTEIHFMADSFVSVIQYAYFTKTYTKKELDAMINKKVLDIKINKEMNYIQKKFPHKPKSFYPTLKKYVSERIYKNMLMNTKEFKNQEYLPEDIKEFNDSLF